MKNKVQFQKGYSLGGFMKNYGSEEQCRKALFQWRWAKRHLSADSYVVSDGLACFAVVKNTECQHTSIVTGGGPECVLLEPFTWVNIMIGNVRSIDGAYHAINHKHLPSYLAEFCYRFNRRFVLEDMLPRLCYVAARTPPMPMRLLKMAEVYG